MTFDDLSEKISKIFGFDRDRSIRMTAASLTMLTRSMRAAIHDGHIDQYVCDLVIEAAYGAAGSTLDIFHRG